MEDVVLPEASTSLSEPAPLRAVAAIASRSDPDAPHPGSLPNHLTSLIGREAEVAAACGLLADSGVRLLTLTGPGGVGKTRLALRIGEALAPAFPDGVVFVPLAPIAHPELVLPTIGRVLGLREDATRSTSEMLADVLRRSRLLLILDNFEQVSNAATGVAALLAACPGVVAMVTSRARLHVAAERRFLVASLALPAAPHPDVARGAAGFAAISGSAAVELFVARAQAVDPSFALDAGNAEAVVAICHRLDGLPLAIELAAAWVHVLSPAALLARLEQRLPLPRGGGADQPARLRTMGDAIAWSYDLLDAEEARQFRRLGVFVDGFTLDAAEAVGAGAAAPSVLDALEGLLDKSMLQVSSATPGESRYQMLDMVREFALEQLALSVEANAVAAAHAAFLLALVERAEPEMLGPDERRWRARFDAELGNLRAALTWALDHDVETAVRIGAALWVYWGWQQIAEGRRWLTKALQRVSRESAWVRARGLTTQGLLAALACDPAQIAVSVAAAVPLAVESGDPLAEARARWIAASSFLNTGAAREAVSNLDRALELMALETSSTARGQAAQARTHRGLAAALLGDVPQAVSHFEEALTQARASGSVSTTNYVLGEFAGLLVEQGGTARARQLAQEALERGLRYEGL